MSLEKDLQARSGGKCELCGSADELLTYLVPESPGAGMDANISLCSTCRNQIENPDQVDANHWRSLNDSMWSEVPAVQVMAWRMLNRLKGEGWPAELLDMMYLDEETSVWAQAAGDGRGGNTIQHIDSNGNILKAGDSVVLIQDLKVKGANFTAKRGTAVRRISLDQDNAEHIEGKVDGQHIVILTKYVKKTK